MVGPGKAAPGRLDGRRRGTRVESQDGVWIAFRHSPSLAVARSRAARVAVAGGRERAAGPARDPPARLVAPAAGPLPGWWPPAVCLGLGRGRRGWADRPRPRQPGSSKNWRLPAQVVFGRNRASFRATPPSWRLGSCVARSDREADLTESRSRSRLTPPGLVNAKNRSNPGAQPAQPAQAKAKPLPGTTPRHDSPAPLPGTTPRPPTGRA